MAQKPRCLGIPFTGKTYKLNSLTDVKGIVAGYSTIISGKGKNIIGEVL